jgi:hypothetical protein
MEDTPQTSLLTNSGSYYILHAIDLTYMKSQ